MFCFHCTDWQFFCQISIPGQFDLTTLNMRHMGRRAFAVCGPDVWNSQPPSLRTMTSHSAFRPSLNTHIYKLAFLSWFYWLCNARTRSILVWTRTINFHIYLSHSGHNHWYTFDAVPISRRQGIESGWQKSSAVKHKTFRLSLGGLRAVFVLNRHETTRDTSVDVIPHIGSLSTTFQCQYLSTLPQQWCFPI